MTHSPETSPILVLAGSGKTGRRIVQRLHDRGHTVRIGSRKAEPPFEWIDPDTWPAVLEGVRAAYVAFAPDLAVPGAPEAVTAFAQLARACGVARLVLLSGRGEEQTQRTEKEVRAVDPELTVVRASFFMQDLSEDFLVDSVRAGLVQLPVRNVGEPLVDAEDFADVAVAALLDDRHAGQTYQVTGPRLLSFPQALAEVSAAAGREVRYEHLPADVFARGLLSSDVPHEVVSLLGYLFTEVVDGRGEHLGDGVQRVLGRAPRDFADYARRTAASGVWGLRCVLCRSSRVSAAAWSVACSSRSPHSSCRPCPGCRRRRGRRRCAR